MSTMRCSYCGSKAVHHAQHFGKSFCKQHLENYLLRKLRRNLNKHKLVSPGDVVALKGASSAAGTAAEMLFRKAVAKWPVKIVSANEKHDKLLVPDTLECESTAIIDGLARGEIHETGYSGNKTIKPFRDFSSKELFALGWLNGQTQEGTKTAVSLGVASQLNLLRSWDQILEFSKRPQNTVNKARTRK